MANFAIYHKNVNFCSILFALPCNLHVSGCYSLSARIKKGRKKSQGGSHSSPCLQRGLSVLFTPPAALGLRQIIT